MNFLGGGMFGQSDQDEDISTVNPTLDGNTTPAASDAPANTSATPTTDVTVSEPTTDAPVTDTAEATVTPEETPEVPEATSEETPAVEPPSGDSDADKPAVSTPSGDDSALLDLKKQALEELSPLLDQLDQTPEEKFKTTMMMIQATDSSDLVTAAHEAALQITDEKIRAQALLDIVNEINYFTQPKE